ncbi:MAG: hypothetical protein V7605_2579 [Acidimicrobiaceae bacterium]
MAWVLGPPGLLQEVTTHLLNSGQVGVMGPDDPEVPDVDVPGAELGPHPAVAVLVKPRPDDWSLALGRGVPIVLVAGRELSDEEVVDAVFRGADAVVHSDSPHEAVLTAVETVRCGGSLLTPVQARAVAAAARAGRSRAAVSLTPREMDIIQSITRGEVIKQTAIALGISAKTVENLQSRLFRKLGVRNRAQAVARAHSLGLIPAE